MIIILICDLMKMSDKSYPLLENDKRKLSNMDHQCAPYELT